MDKKIYKWMDDVQIEHLKLNYDLFIKVSDAEYTRGYKNGYRKALKDFEEKMLPQLTEPSS
jgi:hypothetical protein